MSKEEVKFIKAHGMSIGSHTSTHVDLSILDHDKLITELETSRMRLTNLSETFYAFSYPWGRMFTKVRNAVQASGFDCAVKVGGSTCFSNQMCSAFRE